MDMCRRKFLKLAFGVVVMIGVGVGSFKFWLQTKEGVETKLDERVVKLPEPVKTGKMSVEQSIQNRRSRRSYSQQPVLADAISQLCWAAQGITDDAYRFRAAPSAGALYPIEIFLVVGNSDLDPGIYHYSCMKHILELRKSGDYRKELCKASFGQKCIENAAVNFVITGVFSRTASKYGKRGIERYVFMEAGHVAENIYLQAESLALATVSVGAFYDDNVRKIISLSEEYTPVYIMPVGHR